MSGDAKLDDERWITEAEAAALIGYKPSTLKKWRYIGHSPFKFSKVGRKVLYNRKEVLDAIAANKVENNSQLGDLFLDVSHILPKSLTDEQLWELRLLQSEAICDYLYEFYRTERNDGSACK